MSVFTALYTIAVWAARAAVMILVFLFLSLVLTLGRRR